MPPCTPAPVGSSPKRSGAVRRPGSRRRGALGAALVLVVACSATLAAAEPERPIAFAGSGSCLGITRLLVGAFSQKHPGARIDVPPSIGSTGALRAAADGAVALGLISRPLRADETELGLVVVPFARTAVVVPVHASVPHEEITTAELLQIYRGATTRWRDGREIVVLTREAGDSGIEVLAREVPGFEPAYAEAQQRRRWLTLFTDQDMHRVLAKTPAAIGLSDAGALTAERVPLKALKLDGVPPTADNVRAGRYRLVKTLAFAYRPDRLRPVTRAFLDFVRSAEAAKILLANGYLPAI